jgi:diaminopimelate decarboxylase
MELIINKIGTPLYIFDIDILKERVNYLKSRLNKEYKLVYAVKANSFVIKELDDLVERYEICSPGEFNICNDLKINHNKMVISGVYKDRESIENMVKNYDILKYTIESLNHYKLLNELSIKYNKTLHVLIRLTSGNQFGVSEEDFREIVKDHKDNIIIDGIEYFSGTQKHSLKKIEKEIDYLIEFSNQIEEEFNIKLDEIEYGPGLPVFYFQEEEFDEDNFFNELNNILSKIKDKKIYLESGRSIVASCGKYLTKVVDLKSNKNGNTVIVDGGINHLVYYGQTMAMRIPYYEIYPKREIQEKNYNIYGSLCTINDIIVKNISVPELNIGDIFIFKNTGAYSVTEGISLFLSRDLPKVALYKNKEITLVRDTVRTSDINSPKY